MNLLYIDPGTGSMLFSIFIGLAATLSFGLKILYSKLKFLLSGGKNKDSENDGKMIPYVIFSDHKRYWNVFKPVCDEFEKRQINLVYYTASEDDPVLTHNYKFIKSEFIGKGNKPFSKLNFLHADILIATTPNLGVYQWKRSKYVNCYIHIPHSADELAGYKMFGLDHYDVVLTSGDNQIELIRKMEELRPNIKRKEIVNIGSIPLDNLLQKKNELKATESNKNSKPKVLIAPSWGKSGILYKYGKDFLSKLDTQKFEIIVRPHPQTVVSESAMLNSLTEKFTDFQWNYDNDNFNVLNEADLLITDFSGIIFDFACVFNKPLIYADTEWDTITYDADWLTEPRWSFKVLPEIGYELKSSNFSNISQLIENALTDTKLENGRNKIKSECWTNTGKSSVLAAEFIINKHKELTSNKEVKND